MDVTPYRQGTFLPGCGREMMAPETLAVLRPALVWKTPRPKRERTASED